MDMKIAILNHCYFTPLHIQKLKELGEVTEYPNTSDEHVAIERVSGVDVAIGDCFEFPMSKNFFASAKDLKYLSLNTTGFNLVDIVAAKEHGIQISNLPGFSTEAVAEHAIGLMFAVSKHIVVGDKTMHQKPFQLNPSIRAHDRFIGTNLSGKTLGIIGLGKIGTRIAELAQGLGMKVIAYNRTQKKVAGVILDSIDEVLKKSDVLVLASAFDESLRNFITDAALRKMKPTAVIVNIARGEFIDESALVKALSEKRLAGFGADVIADWSVTNPLLTFENVILTPHMAFLTDESLKNMADIIVENVASYIAGNPKNIVNP
jgi:glycerate dehydrogenase